MQKVVIALSGHFLGYVYLFCCEQYIVYFFRSESYSANVIQKLNMILRALHMELPHFFSLRMLMLTFPWTLLGSRFLLSSQYILISIIFVFVSLKVDDALRLILLAIGLYCLKKKFKYFSFLLQHIVHLVLC